MTILFIVVVAFIVATLISRSGQKSNGSFGRTNNVRKKHGNGPANNWGLSDPNNQWLAVTKVNFRREKILNTSEFRVFTALEKIVLDVNNGHRVMAQTSLGELLKPDTRTADWKTRKDAFASINSKRLDFAIIDRFGYLALAVEYQGGGHESSTSAARDAVKHEALRRAAIPLIEVREGMMLRELSELVRIHLDIRPNSKA